MKPNAFKLIGFGAMALGWVATMIANWASDKQLDQIVQEKVDERIAEKTEK